MNSRRRIRDLPGRSGGAYRGGGSKGTGSPREAEGFGSLEVDDQFELGRLDDWQVRWFLAVKNAPGITPQLAVMVCDVKPIAHEAAGFGILAPDVDCGDTMACRERRDLPRPSDKKQADDYEHCIRRFSVEAGKLRVDLLGCARFQDMQFLPKLCRGIACVW